MKIQRLIKHAAAALAGLALACSTVHTQAAAITVFTNTFPNNGNTGFYQAPSFTYWYSVYQDIPTNALNPTQLPYNLPGTNDASVDQTGDTNDSGSMYVYAPFGTSGDQNVFYITFGDLGSFDQSETMEMLIVTNISWDILVSTNSPTNTDGNFGTLSGGFISTGYGRYDTTYLTIPSAASNHWVHMSETNIADFVAAANADDADLPSGALAFGVCFDQNSYGGFPKSPIAFWIDNVTVQTATAPPPPPPPPTMSIAPAVQGLNMFTGQSTGINNREDLETVTKNYSWIGASGPVSYAFTINSYPVNTNDDFQTQIFLIPNPGTESAPDYSEANVIFLDMESTTTGTQATFRYKTNQINGNGMIYGTNIFGMPGALAAIGTSNKTGTWTLTFNQNTNVTITTPAGTSTNFSIPDGAFVVPEGGQTNVPAGTVFPAGSTSALFSNNVVLYFGVQGNNAAAIADHIVASEFKVTGLGAADFDDNFVTDAATNTYVNGAIWETNAAFPACLKLIGPGNPYWISWTTPAAGYTLESTPTLVPPVWAATTANAPFLTGTTDTQLINTNDLPAGKDGFFNLVQRTFTQLLVLRSGETNAPGTSTGKTGTATPFSISSGDYEDITVDAADPNFFTVSVGDNITLTTSDGGAIFGGDGTPTVNLVRGTYQYQVLFQTTGNQTVTITDNTQTNIAPVTVSVNVTP